MTCLIWCHLLHLWNVNNTYERALIIVMLQTKAWNFTESSTPTRVIFMFFKFYKWYQIVQSITMNSLGNFSAPMYQSWTILDLFIFSNFTISCVILVDVYCKSFSHNFQSVLASGLRCYNTKYSHSSIDPSCISRCYIWFR